MDIARDADYLQGYYSIQSAGSMLACLAMNVKRGQQILDCCAAPVFALWYLLVHTVPMVSVSDMINLLNAILTFISLIWDKQHR